MKQNSMRCLAQPMNRATSRCRGFFVCGSGMANLGTCAQTSTIRETLFYSSSHQIKMPPPLA